MPNFEQPPEPGEHSPKTEGANEQRPDGTFEDAQLLTGRLSPEDRTQIESTQLDRETTQEVANVGKVLIPKMSEVEEDPAATFALRDKLVKAGKIGLGTGLAGLALFFITSAGKKIYADIQELNAQNALFEADQKYLETHFKNESEAPLKPADNRIILEWLKKHPQVREVTLIRYKDEPAKGLSPRHTRFSAAVEFSSSVSPESRGLVYGEISNPTKNHPAADYAGLSSFGHYIDIPQVPLTPDEALTATLKEFIPSLDSRMKTDEVLFDKEYEVYKRNPQEYEADTNKLLSGKSYGGLTQEERDDTLHLLKNLRARYQKEQQAKIAEKP